MPPDECRCSIPISCRFVPYDQWLLTHIQNDWNIKQIKHWILSKCNLVRTPDVPQQRSVSPIFFASPSSRTGYTLGRYDEAEENPECDSLRSDKDSLGKTLFANLRPRPSNKLGNNRLVDQYILIAFSTGRVLQNDDIVSSCNLRPYELVEMHRADAIAPLHREVILEYVQPYFHARIRALLAAWNPKTGRFKPPGKTTEHELGGHSRKRELPVSLRWKPKLEWKDRWVVLHKDILSLSKDESCQGVSPRHQFSLATLKALRGADSLQRACAIVADQRVICLKFRTIRPIALPMTAPSTTSSEGWKTDTSRTTSDQLSSGSEKATEKRKLRKSTRQPYNPDDICRGEGEWVVLDMLDDYAFANMLRVLHRYAPRPVSSSFLPSAELGSCLPTVPTTLSLDGCSRKSVPYPEWRIDIAETARKACAGNITKPLSLALWTEMDCTSSLSDSSGSRSRNKHWQEMHLQSGVIPDCYRTGPESIAESVPEEADSDSNSEMDSELEWEGWMNDLNRPTSVTSEKIHSPSSISSSLPSLRSEMSFNPPKEWNHPIALSNLSTTKSSGRSFDDQASSSMSQRTNSSEVLRESAAAAHTHKVLKTITMRTIGSRAPLSSHRRRSSSVSPEGSAKLAQSFGQLNCGQPPAVSLANGAHASFRALSDAGSPKSSASLRHVRSGSSLNLPPPDISEGPTYISLKPSSSNTPSKPRHLFLRGAERLVRGLDAALDFMDEKSV